MTKPMTAREALENAVRVAENVAALGASVTHVIELFRALSASLPGEPSTREVEEPVSSLDATELERELTAARGREYQLQLVVSLTRTILAGSDFGSLPNDFHVDGMAAERMKDLLNTRERERLANMRADQAEEARDAAIVPDRWRLVEGEGG